MGKISILFNIQHLYYLSQFLPVAEVMKADDKFDIWFSPVVDPKFIDHDLIKVFLLDKGWQVLDAKNENQRRKKILDNRFDVTIFGKSGHSGEYCSKSTLAVLLYHGVGVKSCYYTDYDPRINVRYVEGEYRLEELKKRNVPTELVVTGFPKLDALYDKENIRRTTDILKLDPSLPTILYAPTFYPSSIESFGKQMGEWTKEFNLIVKLHHFSWVMRKYRHQQELFQALSRQYNHIRLLPVEEFNIVPYFPVTDILLTEVSSTAFEFLSVEKPVVICDFYHLRLKHRIFRDKFMRRRIDEDIIRQLDFAFHLKRPVDLPETVSIALKDVDWRMEQIRQKKGVFLGVIDGKASHRVVEDIKKRVGSRL